MNDAPQGMNRVLAAAIVCGQTSPRTFTVSDFGFSDVSDNPPNNLKNVIVTFSGNGTLQLSGNPVPVGVPTAISAWI